MTAPVFDCRMCGDCCQGEGGIVLSDKDRARLAAHLGLAVEDMLAAHARPSGDKMVLRCGPDGACLFFVRDQGCSVHPARPDICRAWPFFRGNLLDPESLAMAKPGCPGIDPDAPFEEFVRQGLSYLDAESLATEEEGAANALRPIPGR